MGGADGITIDELLSEFKEVRSTPLTVGPHYYEYSLKFACKIVKEDFDEHFQKTWTSTLTKNTL